MAAMEHETEPGPAGPPEPATARELAAAREPAPARELAAAREPGEGQESAAAHASTGESRVDAALRLLDRLPALPVAEHPDLFELVHAQLTDVLGELDSGAGGAAGPHPN